MMSFFFVSKMPVEKVKGKAVNISSNWKSLLVKIHQMVGITQVLPAKNMPLITIGKQTEAKYFQKVKSCC